MYLTIGLFILLLAMTWQDKKTKLISDVYIIMLWLLVYLYGSLEVLVISFIFLWSYNLLIKNKMGWADITGFPAVASLFMVLFTTNTILISCVLSMFVLLYNYAVKGNVEVPGYPYVFLAYVLCLLISYIAYI